MLEAIYATSFSNTGFGLVDAQWVRPARRRRRRGLVEQQDRMHLFPHRRGEHAGPLDGRWKTTDVANAIQLGCLAEGCSLGKCHSLVFAAC